MTSRGRGVRTPRATSANRCVAESAAYPGLASISSDTAWPNQTSMCPPPHLATTQEGAGGQ
eukprot:3168072-Pyramimonas_sp.AAC.1